MNEFIYEPSDFVPKKVEKKDKTLKLKVYYGYEICINNRRILKQERLKVGMIVDEKGAGYKSIKITEVNNDIAKGKIGETIYCSFMFSNDDRKCWTFTDVMHINPNLLAIINTKINNSNKTL